MQQKKLLQGDGFSWQQRVVPTTTEGEGRKDTGVIPTWQPKAIFLALVESQRPSVGDEVHLSGLRH
jgi:hypothetical protein